MSDLEWDADEYVPPAVNSSAANDRWEGEDEDDTIKDSWDDDGEEKGSADQTSADAASKKKKKKLQDIIAEKEKRKQEELERRHREREEEKRRQSPNEVLAEKLRLQKIQEDSDLQIANDLLGDKEQVAASLDDFDLSSEKSLDGFRSELIQKLRSIDRLEKKSFYITFVEDFCRDLCSNLESDDIKRVTSVLNTLYNEKVKSSKPAKGKKKGGSKAKLNVGQGAIADESNFEYTAYDEYDDFI